MVEKKFTVINPEGLHLRPAGIFAEQMGLFACEINIIYKGAKINAKSLLSILTACIKCGAEIAVQFDGSDEQQAAERASELIESGFAGLE